MKFNNSKRAVEYGSIYVNKIIVDTISNLDITLEEKERFCFMCSLFQILHNINVKKSMEFDIDDVYIQVSTIKLKNIFTKYYYNYLNKLKDLGFLSLKTNTSGNKSYDSEAGYAAKYYLHPPNALNEEVIITNKSIYKNFHIFASDKLEFNKLITNYKSVLRKIVISNDIFEDLSIEGINSIKDDFNLDKLLKKEIENLNKLRIIESDSVDNYVLIDDFSNRLHTNITNLSRNYRRYLTIDGEKLFEVDITNCQPFLLSLIVDSPKFKQDCIDGIVYERFIDNKTNRDEVKYNMFLMMFGCFQIHKNLINKNKFLNKFKNIYPGVFEQIEEINKDDHRILAKRLQSFESDLIIKKVLPRLFENNIESLTIHDSFLCKEKDCEMIKQILLEEINLLGYDAPKIKIKTTNTDLVESKNDEKRKINKEKFNKIVDKYSFEIINEFNNMIKFKYKEQIYYFSELKAYFRIKEGKKYKKIKLKEIL